MNAKKESGRIALTVRLSAELVLEARRLAPARFRRSDSRLFEQALTLFIIKRKRELFAKSMRRMARDPQAMAENRKIMKEFEMCDNDGLEGL